jgi:hypothetical protein
VTHLAADPRAADPRAADPAPPPAPVETEPVHAFCSSVKPDWFGNWLTHWDSLVQVSEPKKL